MGCPGRIVLSGTLDALTSRAEFIRGQPFLSARHCAAVCEGEHRTPNMLPLCRPAQRSASPTCTSRDRDDAERSVRAPRTSKRAGRRERVIAEWRAMWRGTITSVASPAHHFLKHGANKLITCCRGFSHLGVPKPTAGVPDGRAARIGLFQPITTTSWSRTVGSSK
jgi:hypothetical protein